MFVSNPPPSVTTQYVDNVSGAITAQITSTSGVSQGVLDATGAALVSQMSVLSGMSLIDGSLITTTNGPATRLIVDTYNNANVFGSSYRGRRARGTITSPSGVLEGDVFLQLVGDGYDGSGFTTAKVSYVMFAAENWTTGAHGTYATIRTTPTGSSVVVERIRFAPDGNVGIGNDNPQYRLDVSGSLNVTQGLYVNGIAITGAGDTTMQTFATVVPTGVSLLMVFYPVPYASLPFVSPTIATTGTVTYQMVVQQVTLSGYTALLSDTVTEDGVTINTFAKL